MFPPFTKMTSWTRYGLDSTSLEQMFFTPLSWNHTFITFIIIHSSVEESILPRCFFSMLHRFSIGIVSGELPGQLSVLILFSWINFLTAFELWQGARSCWNVPLPSAKVCRNGKSLFLRISIYFDEIIMPSTGTRLPGLLTMKKPQNIFLLEGILQSAEVALLSHVHMLHLTTLAL